MRDEDILALARDNQWLGNAEGWTFNSAEALITFARRIQQMERERCAVLCEEYAASLDNNYNRKMRHPSIAELQEPYFECAAAIREQSDDTN